MSTMITSEVSYGVVEERTDLSRLHWAKVGRLAVS